MLPYAEATARPRRYREFWLLAVLCVLGLFPSTDSDVVRRFGFLANHPTWYSWLTCQFLHAGPAHLLGNLWVLWIFGPTVAAQLGAFFLPFYFLGGAVAAVVCVGLDQSSSVPMIGASGAIAAVMGYYMTVFPRSRLRVMAGGLFGVPLDMSAFLFVVTFLMAETIAWLNVSRGYDDGVAHLAHLGGLGLGVFIGLCSQGAPSTRLREAATDSGPVAQAEDEGEEELAVQGYVARIEEDVDFRLDPARELKMAGELSELGFEALAKAVLVRLAADEGPVKDAASTALAGLRGAQDAAAVPSGEPAALPAARLVDKFAVSAEGISEEGGVLSPTPWADCLLVAVYGVRQARLKADDGVFDVALAGRGSQYHDAQGLQPVLELVLRRPWRRLRWAPDPADQPGGRVLDMFFQGAGEVLANVILAEVNDALIETLRRRIPPRCVFDSEAAAEVYLAQQAGLALAKRKAPFL